MPHSSRSCGSAFTQSVDFNSVDVLADVTAPLWQQMQLAQHASLPQGRFGCCRAGSRIARSWCCAFFNTSLSRKDGIQGQSAEQHVNEHPHAPGCMTPHNAEGALTLLQFIPVRVLLEALETPPGCKGCRTVLGRSLVSWFIGHFPTSAISELPLHQLLRSPAAAMSSCRNISLIGLAVLFFLSPGKPEPSG